MKEINEGDLMANDDVLANQIPDFDEMNRPVQSEMPIQNDVTHVPNAQPESLIGQKLNHMPGQRTRMSSEESNRLVEENKLSRLGGNIRESAEIREGWLEVDRNLLGGRSAFYPEDWKFRIRPANVEAIRNWSTIDDENPNSIDDVFNEIMKSCIQIVTPNGPLPWGNIRSWDRFFFILLIRQYTFVQGEKKIAFDEDCPNCDNPVTFELNATALDYDLPDSDVMKYFSPETQQWLIDPIEYEVDADPITLYLPTLEKDAAIKAWLISKVQDKKKIDNVFVRFLPWMAPKISKDTKIADRQIRELELAFKSWDTDLFSLMDDILKNIIVTPASRLITRCPVCGEEVTAEIRFPDGVRSIFSVSSGRKKFGKK